MQVQVKMLKKFLKTMWKSKHEESKEKRHVEQKEMKEEIPELEQVKQDTQKEIEDQE
jgi:hypothetical protein